MCKPIGKEFLLLLVAAPAIFKLLNGSIPLYKLIAAAGNEGTSSPSYPAIYPEVIALSAVDSSENVSS